MTKDVASVGTSRALLEIGIMPSGGAWLDQSSTWAQALAILSNEYQAATKRKRATNDE